jgi:hypothetical protein
MIVKEHFSSNLLLLELLYLSCDIQFNGSDIADIDTNQSILLRISSEPHHPLIIWFSGVLIIVLPSI